MNLLSSLPDEALPSDIDLDSKPHQELKRNAAWTSEKFFGNSPHEVSRTKKAGMQDLLDIYTTWGTTNNPVIDKIIMDF